MKDQGLFQVKKGKAVLMSAAPLFRNQSLVNLFKNKETHLVVTQEKGLYHWVNDQLLPWNKPNDVLLNHYNLYSAHQLKNKDYALGTVGKGLLILSKDGTIVQELNQEKGLSNNTILSIFEDQYANIWLGLDNGINLINRSSAFKEYIDVTGQLGSIYTSAKNGDYFYLGTNQGLFVKRRNSNEEFTLVENTQGEVWNLTTINGKLFCGHNRGALEIEGKKAKLISDVMGTWLFRQHPTDKNLIFLGNFTGLYVLEKKGTQWVCCTKSNYRQS